ncbi:manganese ABC transporter ATP-binding protein [Aphanothece hegewaldii CCALA 016]|uniref:Manganese ABC transporter ATP-binding protein n=1 Tax=Aphanothece hegewaldii CCALA 016 TaxID=2107694 RepID=A0A2T1M0S5_9CHRO|nr:metal ABC transporter ATP-binding protein [Aphanothece hegewaldii]PSF38300.1 manganese ABC transporter ATP-binding protein [Aphanothece hegewaldii CCALA 016]
MLEVNDLTVSYRNSWAVQDVSFCLQPGQMTGLLGPNGAGKSTVVKAVLGLIPKASGIVRYASRPLKRQLKKVSYVPQRSQIDWDYPVTVENVVMMGRIPATGWFRKPDRNSYNIVRDALERVGMWNYRQRQIGELSGGQQQRVFIARALAQQANLLFFDEPLAGVDSQTETIIFDVFQELKSEQKTLLVITHDLGESLEHYDQLLLLNKSLIAVGAKKDVMTQENLKKAYGHHLNHLFI